MATARGARMAAIQGSSKLLESQDRVLGELGQGYDAAQGYLGQAGGLYGEMRAAGQPALTRYQGLTTGDPASVQSSLESTPGYQFNFGQGLQALQRTRAAQGMLGSGNTDADAISFAGGLASNTLNQERQALLPMLGMYSQGTAGQAGAYGQQAGLATDYYGNRASVRDNTTKSIVGLDTEAFKAGDAAKSANQAMLMQGATAGLNFLGGGAGAGGFLKLFGG